MLASKHVEGGFARDLPICFEMGRFGQYLGKQSSRWQMLGLLRRYLHESKMSELFEGRLRRLYGRTRRGIGDVPSRSQL
jgi:hypothetical protein